MKNLLLVGCGKMGGALLARWRSVQPSGIRHFHIVDPAAALPASHDITVHVELAAVPAGVTPDIVVFAVKPQMMDGLLPEYAKRFGPSPLYLSIAAGKTLASFARHLGKDAPIVRAMPNTPALIGEGMTALVATADIPAAHKDTANALMAAAGETLWLDDERWMDGVTAISGSGPAYVFLFMEALTQAAMQCGLDEQMAVRLVRQTVKGAALLAQQGDVSALRRQVASPGGTTEAALDVLMKNNRLEQLLVEAAKAAERRAKDL